MLSTRHLHLPPESRHPALRVLDRELVEPLPGLVMHHRLRPSLRASQEIFTSPGYAHAQLRRQFCCVLGLVAMCSRGIVELRVTVRPITAQIMKMCNQ